MRRRAPIALLLFLVLAPAAPASTVSVRSVHEEEDSFITTVEVNASEGERNTMSITVTNSTAARSVSVHDDTASVSPAADSGCTAVDPNTVRCDLSDLDEIIASLGDRNDTGSVTLPGQLAYTKLTGGEGKDELACSWCSMEGGPDDDKLTAGLGSNTLHGEAGKDDLTGGPEGDSLYGGPDDDVLLGGDGPDQIYGGTLLNQAGPSGRDHMDGGPSFDSLSDFDGSDVGPDTLIGGDGIDTVYSYLGRSVPVLVDLGKPDGAGQAGENDALSGIENADGGNAADTLIGNDGPNRLDGWVGDDRLEGRGGNDELISMIGPHNPLGEGPPDPAVWGPDTLLAGDGDDVMKTDSGMASTFSCEGGEDRIELNSYVQGPTGTKPEPTPGPLLDGTCERISMGRFALNPNPVRVGRKGLLAFEFFAFRCCKNLFRLNRSTAPWRSYDKEPISRRRESVRAPRRLARRWRERPVTFRAKVDRAGDALFVWRFTVDRSGR